MSERLASLSGTLDVKNRADGRGVVVEARLPARGATRADRAADAAQEIVLL
jgi:hypothetical protein